MKPTHFLLTFFTASLPGTSWTRHFQDNAGPKVEKFHGLYIFHDMDQQIFGHTVLLLQMLGAHVRWKVGRNYGRLDVKGANLILFSCLKSQTWVKCCSINWVALWFRSLQPCCSAKLAIPIAFVGSSWRSRNTQHASMTLVTCNSIYSISKKNYVSMGRGR
jgi:cell division protein FtsW (lipid II flippase)